jgi:hypothetical protein
MARLLGDIYDYVFAALDFPVILDGKLYYYYYYDLSHAYN